MVARETEHRGGRTLPGLRHPRQGTHRLLQLSNTPLLSQNFRIIQSHETLISRIGDLLRLLPKTQVLPLRPEPSVLAAGIGTSPSSDASDSSSGLFSKRSQETKESIASPASPPPYEKVSCWVPTDLVKIAMGQSPERFVPPSTVWLRPNGFTNLRARIHDTAGCLEPVLALQLKSYADADIAPRPQQAIIVEVVRHQRLSRDTAKDTAVGQLVVVAFFFAMRSCEYSDVEAQRRTTVVQVGDVAFWKGSEHVGLHQADEIRNADTVSITFWKQKNRDDGTTITQHRNLNRDNDELCPVRALGEIVGRIRGYGETTNDKQVYGSDDQCLPPRGQGRPDGNHVQDGPPEAQAGSRDDRGEQTGLQHRQGGNPLH
jgi:hypothetical protein